MMLLVSSQQELQQSMSCLVMTLRKVDLTLDYCRTVLARELGWLVNGGQDCKMEDVREGGGLKPDRKPRLLLVVWK